MVTRNRVFYPVVIGVILVVAIFFNYLASTQPQLSPEAEALLDAKQNLDRMDIQYIQDDKGICFAMVRYQTTKNIISVTPLDCRWIGLTQRGTSNAAQSNRPR